MHSGDCNCMGNKQYSVWAYSVFLFNLPAVLLLVKLLVLPAQSLFRRLYVNAGHIIIAFII